MPSAVKKRVVNADSDQEMEDVEEAQKQASGDEQAGEGDAGEEEEDEEYEIEEIMDAKAGVFAEVRCIPFVWIREVFTIAMTRS